MVVCSQVVESSSKLSVSTSKTPEAVATQDEAVFTPLRGGPALTPLAAGAAAFADQISPLTSPGDTWSSTPATTSPTSSQSPGAVPSRSMSAEAPVAVTQLEHGSGVQQSVSERSGLVEFAHEGGTMSQRGMVRSSSGPLALIPDTGAQERLDRLKASAHAWRTHDHVLSGRSMLGSKCVSNLYLTINVVRERYDNCGLSQTDFISSWSWTASGEICKSAPGGFVS